MPDNWPDPYALLTQHFNPVNTMLMKNAPPMAPFGQEAPSAPAELAKALTAQTANKRAVEAKQTDLAAQLAERAVLAGMARKAATKDPKKAELERSQKEVTGTRKLWSDAMNRLTNALSRPAISPGDPIIKQLQSQADSLLEAHKTTVGIELKKRIEAKKRDILSGQWSAEEEQDLYDKASEAKVYGVKVPGLDTPGGAEPDSEDLKKIQAWRNNKVPEATIKERLEKHGLIYTPPQGG